LRKAAELDSIHTTTRSKAASVILLLFASGVGIYRAPAQAASRSAVAPHKAPLFSRMDLTHHKIALASYRGKVVLLNFWATWCGPCLLEMPTFAEWQKQNGSEKLQVIGVSMDDAAPEVIAAVAKLKLGYPVIMGDEHLGAAYGGVLGLPVTFLIDRHGNIRARFQGAADLTSMKRDLQKLLSSR